MNYGSMVNLGQGYLQSQGNPGAGSGWSIGNPLDWGKADIDQANYQLEDKDYIRGLLQQNLGGVQGRPAPYASAAYGTASQLNGGPQNQSRGYQDALYQQLQGVASGQQQGAGELATQRQISQGLAQQQAMARMARGANSAGGAGLAAQRNAGALGVAGAGQAQQAALQDQSAARGLMGSLAGQMRDQDIGFAGQNAQLSQQMGLANVGYQNQANLSNQQAQLQQQQLNDNAFANYLQQLYGVNMGQVQANAMYDQMQIGNTGIFPDLLQFAGSMASGAAAAAGGG